MTAATLFEDAIPRVKVSSAVVRRLLEGVGVVVLVPIVASQWGTLKRSFSTLGSLNVAWVVVALAFEFASMGAFAQVQRRMLAASGFSPSTGKMTGLAYSSTAINATLPAGSLLSVGYSIRKMRAWGATAPAAAFAVVASGVLSTSAFALLVTARTAASGETDVLWAVGGTAALAAGILSFSAVRRTTSHLVMSTGQNVLNLAARVVHRPSLRNALDTLRSDLAKVHPSRRDWATGLATAELNWVADLACLVACCEAVGAGHAGIAAATAAYVVGMTTSTLSFLPGGLGAVEGGMIVVFVSEHVTAVAATAAVVLYRAMSLVLVVLAGWVLFALDSRRRESGPGQPVVTQALAEFDQSPWTSKVPVLSVMRRSSV